MKQSIASLLAGRQPVERQARDYLYAPIYGSEAILQFASARKVKCDITLAGEPSPNALGYAESIRETLEGVEFTDGTALVCLFLSTFGGTFASHDDAEVRYYVLTPKSKWPNSRIIV